MILGERADTAVLQDRGSKCIVEGAFQVEKYDLAYLFAHHDLDYEPTTIIRREISPGGKSRAFINDTPVKLTVLREFGAELVDIHSQHEKLLLYNPGFHLSIVDAFAQHETALAVYRKEYRDYVREKSLLQQLIEKEKSALSDFDYLQFQVKELEEIDLEGQSIENLEEEASQLSHAEEIKQGLQSAANELSNGEGGVVSMLSGTIANLSRVSDYLKSVEELEGRLKTLSVELDDIVYEMERIQENTAYDPERLETVTDLLNKINHLLFKHGANKIEDLVDLKNTLQSKLADTESLEDAIIEKRKTIDLLHASLTGRALEISKNRKSVFRMLETEIRELIGRWV